MFKKSNPRARNSMTFNVNSLHPKNHRRRNINRKGEQKCLFQLSSSWIFKKGCKPQPEGTTLNLFKQVFRTHYRTNSKEHDNSTIQGYEQRKPIHKLLEIWARQWAAEEVCSEETASFSQKWFQNNVKPLLMCLKNYKGDPNSNPITILIKNPFIFYPSPSDLCQHRDFNLQFPITSLNTSFSVLCLFSLSHDSLYHVDWCHCSPSRKEHYV